MRSPYSSSAQQRTLLPAGRTQRHKNFDPVSGEARRLECFTVRGRPFIATSAKPAILGTKPVGASDPDIWKAVSAEHGGWRSSLATKPWQAGLRTPDVVAGTTRTRVADEQRAELLCNSLLRLCWQNDDEWPWAAVFRNKLLEASFRPGLSNEQMQQELSECERRLMHAMHNLMHARLWRRFATWRRRASHTSLIHRLRQRVLQPPAAAH